MKLDNIDPTSSADFLVTIQGLTETYWTMFSGVSEKFQRAVFADGLSAKKRKARTGSSEYDDATLSKPFDPDKDSGLLEWIEARRDGSQFDVLIRPVKRGKDIEFRGNKTLRLSGCRLMSRTLPGEIDSSKGDQVSTVAITFSVEEAVWA